MATPRYDMTKERGGGMEREGRHQPAPHHHCLPPACPAPFARRPVTSLPLSPLLTPSCTPDPSLTSHHKKERLFSCQTDHAKVHGATKGELGAAALPSRSEDMHPPCSSLC